MSVTAPCCPPAVAIPLCVNTRSLNVPYATISFLSCLWIHYAQCWWFMSIMVAFSVHFQHFSAFGPVFYANHVNGQLQTTRCPTCTLFDFHFWLSVRWCFLQFCYDLFALRIWLNFRHDTFGPFPGQPVFYSGVASYIIRLPFFELVCFYSCPIFQLLCLTTFRFFYTTYITVHIYCNVRSLASLAFDASTGFIIDTLLSQSVSVLRCCPAFFPG